MAHDTIVIHVYAGLQRPGLHIWRPGTAIGMNLLPTTTEPVDGWFRFEYRDVNPVLNEAIRFKLFQHSEEAGAPRQTDWEEDVHAKDIRHQPDGSLPEEVWCWHGSSRVVTESPGRNAAPTLKVHLVTRVAFRNSAMFCWDCHTGAKSILPADGWDNYGPYWDLDSQAIAKGCLQFKFIANEKTYEHDVANRVWISQDGGEIWTHSNTNQILAIPPQRQELCLYHKAFGRGSIAPLMEVRREGTTSEDHPPDQRLGDRAAGNDGAEGWLIFKVHIFTGLMYQVRFLYPDESGTLHYESEEAARRISIDGDEVCWTLEGESRLFRSKPLAEQQVRIQVFADAPGQPPPSHLHVWVNRATGPLRDAVPVLNGIAEFRTFGGITTSAKLFSEHRRHRNWEQVDRHAFHTPEDGSPVEAFVLPGRRDVLGATPGQNPFADPAFTIKRPGSYQEELNGTLHLFFILHAPNAARARVRGFWPGAQDLEMKLTLDGSYWWAVLAASAIPVDFHGQKYAYILNDHTQIQDPAASWIEDSRVDGASLLLRADKHHWISDQWQTPDWDHLRIYQLHPSRFARQIPGVSPFARLEEYVNSGYFNDLGVTALLLMPINAVGSSNSWGYDPSFFYALEENYGTPDEFKQLVDTCHSKGLAVLIDVVFNHAGVDDNVLWAVARESYFDGDTAWGAMINFDHPQCRHFFEQNLVYLAQEYKLDGFRLDHTHTIIHSHEGSAFIRKTGSGGGWEFLHGLREALRRFVGLKCILMAEHLPNEWAVSNDGGPMDTQWCDDFHDRLVDACRRDLSVLPRLADAFRLTHTACQNWYNATNYPESHDEVGNVNDRIANVAGYGQGLRMSKVAAAATLFSRGIPMFFMGAEAGESAQFHFGANDTLDLEFYLNDPDRRQLRAWWGDLLRRRADARIKGPAPLEVKFADGQILALTRGDQAEYFVVLNFGGWSGWKPLSHMNLPGGTYREVLNSSWPQYRIYGEADELHDNGWNTSFHRGNSLHIPDYGVVVLERS